MTVISGALEFSYATRWKIRLCWRNISTFLGLNVLWTDFLRVPKFVKERKERDTIALIVFKWVGLELCFDMFENYNFVYWWEEKYFFDGLFFLSSWNVQVTYLVTFFDRGSNISQQAPWKCRISRVRIFYARNLLPWPFRLRSQVRQCQSEMPRPSDIPLFPWIL